jgi:hypothetical protein
MPQEPAATDAAKTQIGLTPAAERMRRSRNRRRMGIRCYTIQLRDSEIAALVRRGLLSTQEQTDRIAIVKAMHAFLDHIFGWPT